MEDGAYPLVLEAMTLRGLGSYLHGARLEIGPLTILCGTNGSGKSTWFRMLRILRASCDRGGTLPFSFEVDPPDGDEVQQDFTNPLVWPSLGYVQLLDSPAADRDFGPPGTVGLHVKSCVPFNLPGASLNMEDAPLALLLPGSVPHSFLSEGHCPQGTRFRVRMTDPSDVPGIHLGDSPLDRTVELVINDIYSIRFERRHPSPVRHYTATCTRAFWPGCDPQDRREMVVAEFDLDEGGFPSNVCAPSGANPSDLQEWFCRVATARIRELVGCSMAGVHWIGAIRSIERRALLEEEVFKNPDIVVKRDVGGEGEYAQVLLRRFAYNEWRLAGSRSQGSFNYRFPPSWDANVREKLLAARDSTTLSPARRIWESASEESRQAMSRIEPATAGNDGIQRTEADATAQVLNDALGRRDLFHPDYWPDDSPEWRAFAHKLASSRRLVDALRRSGWLDADYGPDPDPDSAAYWQKFLSSFTDDEITAINRLLIESAFPGMLRRHPGLVFQTYYSVWLKRLLDIRQFDDDDDCLADDWCGEQPPCGYLVRYSPDEERSRVYGDTAYTFKDASRIDQFIPRSERQRDLVRLISPPFVVVPVAPVHMSWGFHQVAPLIIQAGLMRANEIMCIENPEVHLHPKLQLDIAEFLVRQAAIGKYMIVETHSDLVVRRVMRAVLEEELRQEAVRLYFARMDANSEPQWHRPVASSVLERIEIDDRGQIRNWPTGFMDDDIRESRRLLDVMYGTPGDDGGDEEAAQ
jgi:hypothetical protein